MIYLKVYIDVQLVLAKIMDKHPVGKCLKEQNQSLNLMLFLSKIIEIDFFILEFFQTGWKMLRNKQIDHFENQNKSGALGV